MRVVEEEPRRSIFAKRLTRQNTPKEIERREEPPAFEHQTSFRRSSAPMEPIPEVHTPRTSIDARKPNTPPAEVTPVDEAPPMVQRNAAPSRSPTDPMFLAEEPIKTRQPSLEPFPAPTRTPTHVPTTEPAPGPTQEPSLEPTPASVVQRSVSLPPEPTPQQAEPASSLDEPSPQPEPDTNSPAPSRKPSLLKRIRTGLRHSKVSDEAAPMPERQPTLPPRTATFPAPERAPTVKPLSRAATQPLVEVKDGEEAVPEVKVNL